LRGVERGRSGFLPHLLVPPLQRAVAFAQMDDVAVAVGQNLHLNVARLLEIFLHVDHVVANAVLASWRAVESASERSPGVCATFMAAPAAARRGLDEHGIADVRATESGVLIRTRRVRSPAPVEYRLLSRPASR